jgi:hypothetical protein
LQATIRPALFGIRHGPSIAPSHGTGKPRLFPFDSGGVQREADSL